MILSSSNILASVAIICLIAELPLFFLDDFKPFIVIGSLFFIATTSFFLLRLREMKHSAKEPLMWQEDDNPNYRITVDKSLDSTDAIIVLKNSTKVCCLFADCSVGLALAPGDVLQIQYCDNDLMDVDYQDMPDGAFIYNPYDGAGLRVINAVDYGDIANLCATRYSELNRQVRGLYHKSLLALAVAFSMFVIHSYMVL